MMNLKCIYEIPDAEIVVGPDEGFISAAFRKPFGFWQGESIISHAVLNPPLDLKAVYRHRSGDIYYALTERHFQLTMRQPMEGRFFMEIDQQCAIDPNCEGEVIVDESCGNPFPIHPTYTVDLPTALVIALEFVATARRSAVCNWRPHAAMNVDWEAYI